MSYTQVDRPWAEWIAWTLEDAGYRVLFQGWDFVPGSNWPALVHQGVRRAERLVLVVSPAYLESVGGTAEWQAMWAADIAGGARRLLPVLISECEPGALGLLGTRGWIDLRDVSGRRDGDEEVARSRLLAGVEAAQVGRGKPAEPVPLPERVGSGAPLFPADLPAVWNVPARLARFVGRQALLDQLHRELSAAGLVAVTTVAGMGGVGKTTLVIEYLHRHADAFDRVGWVPAENPELIGSYLAELAPTVGLSREAVVVAVAGWARQPRSLLVFDNADGPVVLTALRPSPGPGRLLVTSRRAGWRQLGQVVDVPTPPRAEAMVMLTGRFPDMDPMVADRICDLLGDLPLAVEQAAGYLDQTGIPPGEYADLLVDRLEDMLGRGAVPDPVERAARTVATLWELSIARLRREHPAAVALLELWAFCDADAIPLELFTTVPDALGGPLREVAADRVGWAETVGALVGYSLARRDTDTVSVHRLVQAATRTTLTVEQAAGRVGVLVEVCAAVLPGDIRGNPAVWPRWRRCLPHVLAVLARADGANPPPGGLTWLCDRTAVYLDEHGQPDQAVALFRRVLTLEESTFGPDHPDTLAARGNLASTYRSAGRMEQAIALHEQTVADLLRLLGPRPPPHPALAAQPRQHLPVGGTGGTGPRPARADPGRRPAGPRPEPSLCCHG
nr:toll/interleukin-1 receptor domain-containing protein [Candidatus Protofrankia californiensis]